MSGERVSTLSSAAVNGGDRQVSAGHFVLRNPHAALRTSRTLAAKEQAVRIELRVQAFVMAPVAFR
jgi:hypothetical protein